MLPRLTSLEVGQAKVSDPSDLTGFLDRERFPELIWLDLHGLRVAEPWLSRPRARFGQGVRISVTRTRDPGVSWIE